MSDLLIDVKRATSALLDPEADYVGWIAGTVADFACDIWRDYPDWIASNDALLGKHVVNYMTRLCPGDKQPPPPTFQTVPGQCQVNYKVKVAFQFYSIFTPNEFIDRTSTVFDSPGIPGAITDIVGSVQSGRIIRTEATFDDGTDFSQKDINPVGTTDRVVPESLTYIFETVDGSQDNCSDTYTFPQTSPDQENDFVKQIDLDMGGGNTTQVPLVYEPNINLFPINFDFGGLHVYLDLGGINFNFSLLSGDGVPIPLPDGSASPFPQPDDDSTSEPPPPVAPPPNSDNYDEETKPETDGDEQEVGEELQFVKIDITQKPGNAKNQFGNGAPDVYYCGWFEWQAEGSYNYNRTPIHFDKCIFRKPLGATGYAFTVYEGYKAVATEVKTKSE